MKIMKNTLLYSAALFALLAAGCSDELVDKTTINNGNNNTELQQFSFIAGMSEEEGTASRSSAEAVEQNGWVVSSLSSTPQTRITTDITDGVTKWINGDKVHLIIPTTTSLDLAEFEATEVAVGGKKATLTGTANWTGKQMLYGIHPIANSSSYSNGDYRLDAITTQDNTLTQMAMVARPTEVDLSNSISTSIGFAHLYAALGVQLQLPAEAEAGTVKSIVIKNDVTATEATQSIATNDGRTVNVKILSTDDANFAKLSAITNEVSASIVITPAVSITATAGEPFAIYAKIYPADLSGGKSLIFIVTMEDGRQYTATKDGVLFERGVFYKFDNNTPVTELFDISISVPVRVGGILVNDRNVGAQQDGVAYNYTNKTSHPDYKNSAFKGGHYTWEQAKTLCTDGWRLPSKEDLQVISNAIQCSDARAYISDGAGNRCYFPASGSGGSPTYVRTILWSSTEDDSEVEDAWHLLVDPSIGDVNNRWSTDKTFFLSVRCVK